MVDPNRKFITGGQFVFSGVTEKNLAKIWRLGGFKTIEFKPKTRLERVLESKSYLPDPPPEYESLMTMWGKTDRHDYDPFDVLEGYIALPDEPNQNSSPSPQSSSTENSSELEED